MPTGNTLDALALAGNRFIFFNPSCKCKCDTITGAEFDHTDTILRIQRTFDNKILFAFQAVNGLVTINPKNGSIKDKDILSEFLSINDNDIEGLMDFFKKYGFFFHLSENKMESYNTEILFVLLKRLKFLVELISLIQETSLNYRRIYSLICWFIFSNQIVLDSTYSQTPIYSSCVHPLSAYLFGENPYTKKIDQTDEMNDTLNWLDDGPLPIDEPIDTAPETDEYDFIISKFVPDYIYPPGSKQFTETSFFPTDILIPDVNDPERLEVGNFPRIISPQRIYNLYLLTDIPSYADIYTIQYFMHTEQRLGGLASICNDGNVNFIFDTNNEQFYDHLDENLKKATIRVAKYVIKEELDYNLSVVTPSYDIRQMSPAWKIPDLFTALYFSIFYMNSSFEVFRLCANPSCRKPFRVETTRRNKKYCCDACRNAVGQRNYRKNKKATDPK